MSYFWCCPDCGANLDPGERCDCSEKEKSPADVEDRQGIVTERYDPSSIFTISHLQTDFNRGRR